MNNRKQKPSTNDGSTIPADTLTDLPASAEQAEETKAGASKSSPILMLACAQGQH